MAAAIQVVQISVEDWVAFTGTISRMETKLDTALNDIDDHEERIRVVEKVKDPTAELKEHNGRIRSLEKWKWKTVGSSSAIGAVVAIFGSTILKQFN